jgi:tetratricopeptide (TPR) repeat protein
MNHKALLLMMVLVAGMTLAGCAAQAPPAPQSPPLTAPAPSEENAGTLEAPQDVPPPHVVASLQLTDQGRLLLEKGQVDNAIRILERAVNLNPANGQNYYYLAEAWIQKRNPSQAKEFNRLAGLYLHEDNTWLFKVKVQRDRIEKGLQ